MMPKVNEKVKIIRDKETVFGTIVAIYPPNIYHSGRFDVLIHEKNRTHVKEFWFSDYGKSVIAIERAKDDNK